MKLLITGASGQLGGYLLRELSGAGGVVAWCGRSTAALFDVALRPVDLTDREQIRKAYEDARPDAVLHLAAFSAVAQCHADPDAARRINVEATRHLAELADASGARLVTVSTDLVFDGRCGDYAETDSPNPLMVYGRTKWQSEGPVLASKRGAVVRLPLMFGPTVIGKPYFFDQQLARLRAGQQSTWFQDEFRSMCSLLAAARALIQLVRSDFTGLLHLGGPEKLSRHEFGLRLAAYVGAPVHTILPIAQASIPTPEPRPRDVSFNCSRWHALFPRHWRPGWDEAMHAMMPGH